MSMFRHDVLTEAEAAAERWAANRARRGELTTEEQLTEYADSYLAAQAEDRSERGALEQ